MAGKSIVIGSFVFIFILALVGGIIWFTVTIPDSSQTVIPPTCSVDTTGSVLNTYRCGQGNSAIDSCSASVTLTCNVPSTSPEVILRWSENVFRPNQIAVDKDNDGDLDRLIYTDDQVSNSIPLYIRFPNPISSSYVARSGSTIAVCAPNPSGSIGCRRYIDGGSIPTDAVPTEPYASSGRELIDGTTNIYQCTQQITGSVTRTVSYSGNTPGTRSETVSLTNGQTINWNGAYGNRINYTESDVMQSQCTRNEADNNDPSIYYLCVVNNNGCGVLDTTRPQYCADNEIYNEENQDCQPPYNLNINLAEDLFAINEDIVGSVQIADTPQRAFIDVRIELLDSLNRQTDVGTITTNTQGRANFNFDGQSLTGEYTIRATTLNHPAGSITTQRGIRVEAPIFLRLAPEPDVIQYTSSPIQARAFVTNANDQPENVQSWDFAGTRCGNVDVSRDVAVQRVRTGEYVLSVDVESECNFIYQVIAVDQSGFRSEADALSITVREASIVITPDLSSVQDQDEGRHTITFLTLDQNNQPVQTSNQVTIIDSDGCRSGEYCLIDGANIPSVTVSGTNGNYQFSHNFKDGLNTIQITSTHSTFGSTTQQFVVNLFPSGQTDPGDGGEGSNIGLIITIIVVVLGVGLFFYLVFRRRK